MRKLARTGLIVTLLGLPAGLGMTGCTDNAGGNENTKTKGVVAPDAPQSPEEYYKQHKATLK